MIRVNIDPAITPQNAEGIRSIWQIHQFNAPWVHADPVPYMIVSLLNRAWPSVMRCSKRRLAAA